MDAPAVQLRTCSKCGGGKPTTEFYKHRGQPGGFNVWCKGCYKAYAAKNAHKKKAYAKRYYLDNAEETKKYLRNYRKEHGEEIRTLDKQKHRKDPRAKMLKAAAQRAREKNLEFSIKAEDVSVPETCPLLGIPIAVGAGKHCAGSPTLDRKDPRKGYVRGNVWIISHRANSIKRDATVQELRTLAANLGLLLNEP